MAGIDMQNVVLIALVVVVAIFLAYQYNPYLFSSIRVFEGFEEQKKEKKEEKKEAPPATKSGFEDGPKKEEKASAPPAEAKQTSGFADLSSYEGPAQFGSAEQPAGCYPRDQLTPSELLPKDMASIWAEQNPMGPGSLKGKNFLSAGALIGVNTVGQSMRNANLQVRSEPPNPQVAVSIFNQSTISPDISHRPLEIGA
jgi:hypothetical protein